MEFKLRSTGFFSSILFIIPSAWTDARNCSVFMEIMIN